LAPRRNTGLPGRHGSKTATTIALGLYTACNIAAALASVPADGIAGRLAARVMAARVALFALAYAAFAIDTTSIVWLAPPFIAARIAIGCVETAEHAAVAALAPEHLCAARRSGCPPPL
jgi:MFS family permease